MENIYYMKMINEDYKVNMLTLNDFIHICDTLKLAFFEVEVTLNPFAEPHRVVNHKVYESATEYRKTMPDWSGREYDYENDRILGYYHIPGIEKGCFEVTASNKSTSYKWAFEIVGQCVVVHKMIQFTD